MSDVASKAKAISNKGLLSEVAPVFAMAAAFPLVSGVIGYITAKKHREEAQEGLRKSYAQLLARNEAFQSDPAAFSERFYDLATLSPTLATNPNMAEKLLEKRMKSGFSIDDVSKITGIQAQVASSGTPLGPQPGVAARAAAARSFDRYLTLFGSEKIKKVETSLENHAKREALIQKISSARGGTGDLCVSEETLARMLSDRYLLVKEAAASGVLGAAGAGMKNLIRGGAYLAAPVVLAGATHAIGSYMEKRERERNEQEAESAYNSLVRKSEIVKENPALAREAFDTLKSFAPALAAKPIVMRSFIEYVVNSGHVAPQTVKELGEAESSVSRAKGRAGFFDTFKPHVGAFREALDASQKIPARGRRATSGGGGGGGVSDRG